VVISGHAAAVERAMELAKERGAKRALPLAVSAPFHCALMAPAAEVMAKALTEARMQAPLVPLYANVTAAPIADPDAIRGLLVEQVTGMVRWRESVIAMTDAGVTEFVEFGGKVLGPMIKRISPDTATRSVVTMDDIEALVGSL
jgi:[acyl-carrier-protein] S-malonyltransferase